MTTELQALTRFAQELKEALYYSPCMFEQGDPTDERSHRHTIPPDVEGEPPYIYYDYTFDPGPPRGSFSSRLNVEITVIRRGLDRGYDVRLAFVVHTPIRDDRRVSLVEHQRLGEMIAVLQEGVTTHFPSRQPHILPGGLTRWTEPTYPAYAHDFNVAKLSAALDVGFGHHHHNTALWVGDVRCEVIVQFLERDEHGKHDLQPQLADFAERVCRFWLEVWDPALAKYLATDLRDLSETDYVLNWDPDLAECWRADYPSPEWIESRTPPAPLAYDHWRSIGWAQAVDDVRGARVQVRKGKVQVPEPSEDLARFGPRTLEAYEFGYRSGVAFAIASAPHEFHSREPFPLNRLCPPRTVAGVDIPMLMDMDWADPEQLASQLGIPVHKGYTRYAFLVDCHGHGDGAVLLDVPSGLLPSRGIPDTGNTPKQRKRSGTALRIAVFTHVNDALSQVSGDAVPDWLRVAGVEVLDLFRHVTPVKHAILAGSVTCISDGGTWPWLPAPDMFDLLSAAREKDHVRPTAPARGMAGSEQDSVSS